MEECDNDDMHENADREFQNVHQNIEKLSLALFKEQLKISHTKDVTLLTDYCVQNIDKLSDIVIMLIGEMTSRLERGIEEKGWEGITESASDFGLTSEEVIDNTCSYFSHKRAELGLSRDKLMQIMMQMQKLEKTYRKFQQNNEGEHDGS